MTVENVSQEKYQKETGFDPAVAKEFLERYFTTAQEAKALQRDLKDLREEYKNKLNMKLITRIVKLVKAKLDVDKSQASIDTIQVLEDLVRDQIGKIVE
jgi:phage protein D